MKTVDERFLVVAGFSAAKAADILARSRQTVSRGVRKTDGRYFKDHDIAKLYNAVRNENPILAPSVHAFITDHYAALGDRLGMPPVQDRLVDRLDTARRMWLTLPDFRLIKPDIWPTIATFFRRPTLSIDVFVGDRADYMHFLTAAEAELKKDQDLVGRRKTVRANASHQQVLLWQPNPVIGLAAQLVILEPQSPEDSAVFIWDGRDFHPMAGEYAVRLSAAFVNQLLDPPTPSDRVSVRRLALNDPDCLTTMDREAAIEKLAGGAEGSL